MKKAIERFFGSWVVRLVLSGILPVVVKVGTARFLNQHAYTQAKDLGFAAALLAAV
ncbi:MAG: hypothetical protein JNL98_30535 [Bryobacterales bacterium]|nr:hypothetical protein [Bryobacterales bacterium]